MLQPPRQIELQQDNAHFVNWRSGGADEFVERNRRGPEKIENAGAQGLRRFACDKAGLGFLLDPFACDYDPARDAAALCVGPTSVLRLSHVWKWQIEARVGSEPA